MKKYELTNNSKTVYGKKLFQIRALVDFGDVKAGSLGGYVEKEENLSQCGESWVYNNAMVFDNAKVYGKAGVYGNAMVRDDAMIYGNAMVYDNAKICGNTGVFGSADVAKDARITSDADLLQITGLGSIHRTTTVYHTQKNGIEIVCGCFRGDLEEFRKQVVETRKGKVRDEYLKFAELIEIYFNL